MFLPSVMTSLSHGKIISGMSHKDVTVGDGASSTDQLAGHGQESLKSWVSLLRPGNPIIFIILFST